MKRFACLFGVLVLALAGTVQAESVSFSTDFSGTTLNSNLTAAGPTGTQQALDGNGHLLLFTSPDNVARNADIWGVGNMYGVRATYGTDAADTRDFSMETVVTSWTESGDGGDHSNAGILLVSGDGSSTYLFGVYANSTITVASSGGSSSLSSAVSSSAIIGDNVNVGLKVTREGTKYTFSYQLGSGSGWNALGDMADSYGVSSVGLYSKTWTAGDTPNNISNATFDSMSFTVVPEPSAVVMVVTGFLGLLAYAWRKRK